MFGSKDLAALLGGTGARNGDAEDSAAAEAFKPKVDLSKRVPRYFAGQAPQWDASENAVTAVIDRGPGATAAPPVDRRLARLAAAASSSSSSGAGAGAGVGGGRRRVYEAEVVVDSKQEDDEEGDVPSRPAPSERQKHVAQVVHHTAPPRAIAQAQVLPAPQSSDEDTDDDDDDDEDEDDDEEEEEEEEEEVLKPVFVPRAKRQTVAEEAAKLAAEEAAAIARASEREGRKQQSRSMVSAAIQRADAAQVDSTDVDSDAGLPDDADCQSAAEAEAELKAWRLRELRRVRRDFEARQAIEQERAEMERRRGLTDAERSAEDEASGRLSAAAARVKAEVGFMQKYHHKGAFYMDEASLSSNGGGQDDVRRRDNHAPTGEDKFNKAALPAVLQVKKFGMKGRTKYTHLLDQDTTAKARPIRPEGGGVEERLLERRAWDIDGAGRASKKPKM